MSDDADRADDLDDDDELAPARAIFHSLFHHLSLSDAIEMSGEGSEELDLPSRAGYTYGETSLSSILHMLRAAQTSSFCCACGDGAAASSHSSDGSSQRCQFCGRRDSGATIVDLGSGLGNVVVGTALLVSAGLVSASRVRGVEALPTLHRAAAGILAELQARFRAADDSNRPLLPARLPAADVQCTDLLLFDLEDVDVCYLCSTGFSAVLIELWSAQAARQLRVGSRVVTLSKPLGHPSFELELTTPCRTSWDEVRAFVHRTLSRDWLDGAGALLRKGCAKDGRATQWAWT